MKKLEVGATSRARRTSSACCHGQRARWARHRPLIVTAVFTGMRASELRGLPWWAVDFDKRTITVRQRADEWGTIGMPKSAAGQREIPMSPTVLNTLREWKLACPKGELDLVFPNTLGKVQPLTNIATGLAPAAEEGRPGRRRGRAAVQFPCAAPLRRVAVDRTRVHPEAAAGDARALLDADDLRPLRPSVPVARRTTTRSSPRARSG